MKTAKRILLCTLVLTMLIACFSVNTSALSLGAAQPYTDATGAKLFDIYLWNHLEPGPTYMLYAELTVYEAADYTFGACYASIYGYNATTRQYEHHDADDQNDEYLNEKDVWDFAAAYFQNDDFCMDEVSVSNFTPVRGSGTAIVGYYGYGEYRYKFYGADDNPGNIKFTPARKETASRIWTPLE